MKVLFVCLGNICRSPAGQIIFEEMIRREGVEDKFLVDSAGTEAAWPGARPDRRMRRALGKRNYADHDHRARRITQSDLEFFDVIVTMDDDNYREVLYLGKHREFSKKIRKMVHFVKTRHVREIPDPWYGGQDGFYKVIDLLEDGCKNLLKALMKPSEEK